ncbi:MAG: hypothetical protein JO210_18565, partial [Acidobacteriaceae bacterium]|nr:hypothetical protein [Acidobacteriaceae bacterium]
MRNESDESAYPDLQNVASSQALTNSLHSPRNLYVTAGVSTADTWSGSVWSEPNVAVGVFRRDLPRGEKMPIANLRTVRQTLETKRQELLSGTSNRDEILIEKAADDFDRLQQQLNREVAIDNLDRTSKLLKKVQAAIVRITDGTFGVCLNCE